MAKDYSGFQTEITMTTPATTPADAWTDLLAYALQDDLHNRLTPRVIDIAYSAFMAAKAPNKEDGGPSDWFNDTRPMVIEAIAKLRKDLAESRASSPRVEAQSVPDGYVLVPKELPQHMVNAVTKHAMCHWYPAEVRQAWALLLAAAEAPNADIRADKGG